MGTIRENCSAILVWEAEILYWSHISMGRIEKNWSPILVWEAKNYKERSFK